MNRFLVVSLLLFLSGAICFGISGYCYWTLNQMFESLAYYSLEKEIYKHSELATTVFNLKFAIVKFLILGILSWVVGVIVFVKRKSKLL